MLRDWKNEMSSRVAWIREYIGGRGVIFGNSGGKDSALVGILCRRATEKVFGVIMPCESSRNYGEDRQHALTLARQFDIHTLETDLTDVKAAFRHAISPALSDVSIAQASPAAEMNINPRLRMTALYTLGQTLGCLVAGTGNRSERAMGYFTKWGDGACDFNPIADITATETLEFLRFLGAPQEIIEKPPSAGLYEGQTDEAEMGITYAAIDAYLLTGTATPANLAKIQTAMLAATHKLRLPACYSAFNSSEATKKNRT